MKRVWFIVLVVFFLVVILLGVQHAKKPLGIEVTVAQATTGDFVREVSGTGNVEARTYTLSFSRTGRIARVLVREGEHVRAGAVLAELATAPEVEDVAAARDKLQALTVSLAAQQQEARADLQQRDIDLAETCRKLALTRTLYAAPLRAMRWIRWSTSASRRKHRAPRRRRVPSATTAISSRRSPRCARKSRPASAPCANHASPRR